MATINYNGMELKEFTSDKPVVFDKPVRALCWNNNGWQGGICEYVIAFIPRSDSFIAVTDHSTWLHMALLPDPPKSRRATNRELAKWLAQGNGECGISKFGVIEKAEIGWFYDTGYEKQTLQSELRVRKWDDTEWHKPTVDYLGIGTNAGEKE